MVDVGNVKQQLLAIKGQHDSSKNAKEREAFRVAAEKVLRSWFETVSRKDPAYKEIRNSLMLLMPEASEAEEKQEDIEDAMKTLQEAGMLPGQPKSKVGFH